MTTGEAAAQRDPCNFGEVFATDGPVAALDLTLLEDDEASSRCTTSRRCSAPRSMSSTARRWPELYAPLAAILDNETMAALNARVSSLGHAEADVARDFLEEHGFITG